jgi:structural maintenance of chromosome 1
MRHNFDVEQLSGGEKSIAALSFMFALTAVTRQPLIIMEEDDAFLDSGNFNKEAEYWGSRAFRV